MKNNLIVTLMAASAILVACKPGSETEAPAVAETAAPAEAAEAVAGLPVHYSTINLTDVDNPMKLTA